jgi:hypothetical protein
MRTKPDAEKYRKFSISLPPEVYDRMVAEAKRQHRKPSNYIAATLTDMVNEETERAHPRVCPASGCGSKNANACKIA